MQRSDYLERRRLDPVRNRDEADRLVVDRNKHRRLILRTGGIRRLHQSGWIGILWLHHGADSDGHAAAIDKTRDTIAGDAFEFFHGAWRDSALCRTVHGGMGKRMFQLWL